ncbi:hypothetical protein O7598_26530 [Micromonospora sp. WMMC241]|uniref:hypothetical protein n=1 Tax=Micromonospora sp. WMMC241 TaxID=3015159 RepID=UPI0022B6F6C1|nr:hypothetical protein [Micromonospora sp. WMMC241]MCZ7439985.1 hypothetical protein [Micromonospora sp. WMMC241]
MAKPLRRSRGQVRSRRVQRRVTHEVFVDPARLGQPIGPQADPPATSSLADVTPLTGLQAATANIDLTPLQAAMANIDTGLQAATANIDLTPLQAAMANIDTGLQAATANIDLTPLQAAMANIDTGLQAATANIDLTPLQAAMANIDTGLQAATANIDLTPLQAAMANIDTGLQAATANIDLTPLTGLHALIANSLADVTPLTGLLEGLLEAASASTEAQPSLWTPERARRRHYLSSLTPEQRVWLLVILVHLMVASVQHVSSLVNAQNPHFDIEKFVAHHVQALGVSLGYYSLKKTMKK